MKRILLVDDDPTCNFIHSKILLLSGYVSTIDIAHNGEEGLKMLDEYKLRGNFPDIILLDLNMPILDGFGFLRGFRDRNLITLTNAKIIMVSSSLNESDILKSTVLGAYHYLAKPLMPEEIIPILR